MALDRDTHDDALGASLGAATEQLRAALEREAVEVINRARAEAARIEEAARLRAEEVEQQARDRAVTMESERLTQLIHGIDALEEHMRETLAELRAELRDSIQTPQPPAEPVAETAPAAPQDSEAGAGSAAAVEPQAVEPAPAGRNKGLTFPKPVPMSLATEVDAATDRSPELDEMMRAQIVTMVESGKSRDDAEHFVSRFRFGDSYIGLVDEIYSHREEERAPGTRGRRRRFGRRRD